MKKILSCASLSPASSYAKATAGQDALPVRRSPARPEYFSKHSEEKCIEWVRAKKTLVYKIFYQICASLLFPCIMHAVSVEVDISPFFPTNSIAQKVYGHVWPDLAITIDHLQPFCCVPQISFFGQVDFLVKNGRSCNFGDITRIRLIPISAGIKWIQPVGNCAELYLGAAPKYYFMHIRNDSTFVLPCSNQHHCGALVSAGAFLYPTEHLMLNIFLNYSYIRFPAPRTLPGVVSFRTNASGINFGLGIGYDF